MATSIRLKRVGAKKEASFRIVVMDSREGTSGSSIERLGIYNPRTSPSLIRLNAARTLYWLREGAMPSDTVRSLLRQTGVWEKFSQGVAPEDIEEPVIELGPPPDRRHTSQRPAPVEKAMRGGAPEAAATAAAAAAAPAAAAVQAEEAVAAEPAAESAAEEIAADEPAVEADVESEEAPAAEAVEEPAAAADEEPAATAEEEPAATAEAADAEADEAGEEEEEEKE